MRLLQAIDIEDVAVYIIVIMMNRSILINQIYEISKSDSVSPDQLPGYLKQKLEEKQRIDEQIKEADDSLQVKNVKAKAINEYTKLNEKLDEYGLSTQDVNKLVKFVMSAKRYGLIPKMLEQR